MRARRSRYVNMAFIAAINAADDSPSPGGRGWGEGERMKFPVTLFATRTTALKESEMQRELHGRRRMRVENILVGESERAGGDGHRNKHAHTQAQNPGDED